MKFKPETQAYLLNGFHLMCLELEEAGVPSQHLKDTPKRVVEAYMDMFQGLGLDPVAILSKTSFTADKDADELVTMDVPHFTSFCAHHLLPFTGHYRFAYLPGTKLTGLSKIPRFINVLAARPQIQEELTTAIVNTFVDVMAPKACGLIMTASHGCMECRGVRTPGALTTTTAIRGLMKTNPALKEEFLKGYNYAG